MSERSEHSLVESLAEALRPLVAELVEHEVERRLEEIHANGSAGRKWLTLEEAAERLGCSPDAVRQRANRGRLEDRYQGRRRYISADSVENL